MAKEAIDGRPNLSDLELIWRCLNCGEHLRIEGDLLPDRCPSCGSPKTEFERVRED